MRYLLSMLTLWILVFSPPTRAQEAEDFQVPTEKFSRDTTGLWLGSYTKYRLSDRFFYYGEYHFRRRNGFFARDMAQIYLRFGVTYRPNDQMELTAGIVTPMYWTQDTRPNLRKMVPQFRLWQQALLSQTYGRVRIYHQFRTEQRWARAHDIGAPLNEALRAARATPHPEVA